MSLKSIIRNAHWWDAARYICRALAVVVIIHSVPAAALDLPSRANINSGLAEIPDPGIPDTLRIQTVDAVGGEQAVVEIDFYNDEELSGIVVPLIWSSVDAVLDSVDFAGSRVDYIAVKPVSIDNINRTVLIPVIVLLESFIPAGQGLYARLFFSIMPGAPDQVVNIDSTFLPPGNTLEFFLDTAEDFVVQYVPGNIIVGEPLPPIVESLADSGPGSLREVLEAVNIFPGPDTVEFVVSGTINLATPLPALTDDGTVILGSTAPGGIHSITIDGSGLSSGDGLTIQSSDNIIEGLTITGFPENGITVEGTSSAGNTVTNNLIYDNGGLAIDLGGDGVTLNDPGDVDTGPNDLLNYPVIDSINSQLDETFIVYGRAANDATIEMFVAHPAEDDLRPADPSGHGEAYEYIGAASASPTGDFSFATDPSLPLFSVLTGTATDLSGNTSEISENFVLLPKPMIIMAYTFNPGKAGLLPQNGINMIIEDPNGDTIGLDENNVPINQIPGAEYIITANDDDSIHIPEPVVGDYDIAFIPEAGGGTGSTYSSIIRVDGSQQVVISIGDVPTTGQVDTVTYTYDEGCDYINADADTLEGVNIADAVYIIDYIFKDGPAPQPLLSGDANCDGHVNIADAVYLVNYIFKGGPAPCSF